MFGLTIEKLVLIAAVAALVIGPDRLPASAATLARWTRQGRRMFTDGRRRVVTELDELEPDWRELDPRRYDPRRIVRSVLTEHEDRSETRRPEPTTGTTATTSA